MIERYWLRYNSIPVSKLQINFKLKYKTGVFTRSEQISEIHLHELPFTNLTESYTRMTYVVVINLKFRQQVKHIYITTTK